MRQGVPWAMKPQNEGDEVRFGAKVYGERPKVGDKVEITSKAGKQWVNRITRVVWSSEDDDGRTVHGCTTTKSSDETAQVTQEEMWQIGDVLSMVGDFLTSGNSIKAGEILTKLGKQMTEQYAKPKAEEKAAPPPAKAEEPPADTRDNVDDIPF